MLNKGELLLESNSMQILEVWKKYKNYKLLGTDDCKA